jgi:2-polyprenyl-6-methoxyphenol hydroxylase-like FAD-dependent oxidoreductase/AraC-like DNA-binding protein
MEQLVARRAHNPKVVGSSPAPATKGALPSAFEVLPDGHAEIVFHFGSGCSVMLNDQLEPLPSPFIVGLLSQPVYFHAKDHLQIIGVKCLPWALYDLLKLPSVKGGVQIITHPIALLQTALEPLLHENKIDEALALVRDWFMDVRQATAPAPALTKAGQAMLKANGSLPVNMVAAAAHATVRTLERKFKASSGHTVKDVSGLIRFEQARDRLWDAPDTSISALAHELGYADQSHLNREFKRYSGTTVAAFAKQTKERKKESGDDFVAIVLSSRRAGSDICVMKNQKVLISGASIAGLSTAWWLNHIGYRVTVIELAAAPRTQGAAVDLNAPTVAIAKRMGLYEQLRSYRLGVDRIEYKNADDVTEGTIVINAGTEPADDEIEIEREKFVAVMMVALKYKVEFIFSNNITALEETEGGITATFNDGGPQNFDLVIGCDGSHSGTRKIWFGPENNYAHFLGAYFSISIVNKALVPQRTMQTFSVPYKSVMLNAYNHKTDIIFMFVSETDIPYSYRDIVRQREIIVQQFEGQGWRTPELLEEIEQTDSFYFDKFCQIKMPSWSKGRVVLVGDAAYCPSPAAGQGGSLAMQGAAAIADALLKHNGNHELAFMEYERNLRPSIEEIQATAEQNVKTHFILKTEEEICKRNTEAKLF